MTVRRGQDELMRKDGYVTAAEVAAATNQTLSTVHRGIEGQRIPGGKVGSGWYVDIYRYAEQYEPAGPASGIRLKLDELKKLVDKPAEGLPTAAAPPPRTGRQPRRPKRTGTPAS